MVKRRAAPDRLPQGCKSKSYGNFRQRCAVKQARRHHLKDVRFGTRTLARTARTVLPTDGISGLFEAVLDATEQAVGNSLLKATDVAANGRTVRAMPVDVLRALLKKYGR